MPQAQTNRSAPTASPAAIPPGRPGAPAIPLPVTSLDVSALRERVDELRSQLRNVTNERSTLSAQLRGARPGPDASGLESHIAQLDTRTLGIESDMADLNRALAAAPNGLYQTSTSTAPPAGHYGQLSASQQTGIAVVGMIFVGAPLVIATAMIAMQRLARRPVQQVPKEVADRLENMERGIEAVAIEVERIGEGQRFVTQLMSDRAKRAALPEGVPRA